MTMVRLAAAAAIMWVAVSNRVRAVVVVAAALHCQYFDFHRMERMALDIDSQPIPTRRPMLWPTYRRALLIEISAK